MKTWIGRPSDTVVPVVAWMEGAGTSAQLGIATDDGLSDVVWGSSVSPDIYDLVRLEATGLDPDTRYYWAVWESGQLEPTASVGDFRTFPTPGTPASYRFWAGTCAGTGSDSSLVTGTVTNDTRISNSEFFDDIAASNAAWGWHGGDMLYYNPGGTIVPSITTDVPGYVSQWTDVLQQTRQEALYQKIPLAYTWDDHEYGTDNSNKNQEGRENAQEAYRRVVPHHDLPDPEGIWQSWQHGRVLYIASDTRSYRDPNTDPQTSTKTMLGGPQKAWMQNLLETSDAEFLVWLCPASAWWNEPVESGSDNDSWRNYPHERDEILGWLTANNWVDRMLYITGDKHSLGIDSGSNNPWGGFPFVQAAPIDANPSSDQNGGYDRGWRGNERGHWARIDVTDDGEIIRFDIAGMVGSSAVLSHTIIYDTADPEPPPPPPPDPIAGPAPVAVAAIRQEVTWLGVHRSTGRIIAQLPDVTGDPKRRLSAFETSRMSIPLANGGPGWVPHELLEAVSDGRTGALVAVVNDIPMWMGLPTVRVGGSGPNLDIPCATPEAYLLKRKVRDASYEDTDRARVALALAQQAEELDGVGQGLGFEYDVEDTGELTTIEYKTTARQAIYDALRGLCVEGLEFEVYFDWADSSQTVVSKILRIRRRIGRITGTPLAMFENNDAGSVISYSYPESWAEGLYANHVTGIAPGQGEDQPVSDAVIDQDAIDAGGPWVELVVEPGNEYDSKAKLDPYVAAEADRTRTGSTEIQITARLDAYPRPSIDLSLGDMASYLLESDWHPNISTVNPTDHRLRGQRRLTSWTMHPEGNSWTPGLITDPTLGVS